MKNKMKKILAAFTAAAMTLTVSIGAFAAKFPDVTEEEYGWAIDAIESMADEGIIKGYEDGTFNPAKTVSKIESLVLISRILGVNEPENERIVETAWDIYGEEIAKYNLPYGEQRELEIVRALASNPKLLLLDEPAAGMNPQETHELMKMIAFIRKEFDVTILLIEHDMKLVMGICEKILVLDYGRVIASGKPEDIRSNPQVIKAYLGGDVKID